MDFTTEPDRNSGRLVSYFWSDETIRSRSVSGVVIASVLDVPEPPRWLLAHWKREVVSRLDLQPGDVQELTLTPARSRWPDYRGCVQKVQDWTHLKGLGSVIATSTVALMVSRGARYHHDGNQYGGMAFCNLFLSDDCGQDLHFPSIGCRIPLTRGTVVIFDTCQPHAVIARTADGFCAADFPADQDCNQVFLTWELPLETIGVANALQITFDTDPVIPLTVQKEQVWMHAAPAHVSPRSGQWCTDVSSETPDAPLPLKTQ